MSAIPTAATVLLVRDDPFEVLMVRRSAAGPFPSAMVFPGGTIDADDADPSWVPLTVGGEDLSNEERAIRIGALRETFEEVGLLVAVDADGQPVAPASCEGSFREVVEASGGRLPLDALVPFARWVTPEAAPRRWDTHFLICAAPPGQQPVCDDHETHEPQWLAPKTALGWAATGERDVLFPTRLNLMRLDESNTVEEALAAARARPRFTVHARGERRPDGVYSVIPAEAGYAETEGLMNSVGRRGG